MIKLYVYDFENLKHIATIIGDSESICESAAIHEYVNSDCGWTFDPHGLVINPNPRIINVE